jgi:hypothetical protein
MRYRIAVALSLALAACSAADKPQPTLQAVGDGPASSAFVDPVTPASAVVMDGVTDSLNLNDRSAVRAVDTPPVAAPQAAPRSVPAGASAVCRDGTYSFSANRRGTCSHHGGVGQWL